MGFLFSQTDSAKNILYTAVQYYTNVFGWQINCLADYHSPDIKKQTNILINFEEIYTQSQATQSSEQMTRQAKVSIQRDLPQNQHGCTVICIQMFGQFHLDSILFTV